MLENTKERSPAESSSRSIPCILNLKFPFKLTKDQSEAVEAWVSNKCRGSIIYSTGTGKTEIAFECAKRRAEEKLHHSNVSRSSLNNNDSTCHYNSIIPSLLFLVPRIVLVEQNFKRLLSYHVSKESIGVYFGERKEIREITISTYQSIINNI
jgi:superfamily II DNA or RNA helicase